MSDEYLPSRATNLRQAVKLLQDASEALISEWTKDPSPPDAVPASETGIALPSHAAYDAQRIITAALGSIEELVAEPHYRLMDFSYGYLGTRALHVALNNDIALLLAGAGERGVPVAELAEATGIHESKLGIFMGFAAALALPETLKDPVKGPSQDPNHAAWGTAMGTDLSYFEWMHQKTPLSQAAAVIKAGGHSGVGTSDPATSNSDGDAAGSTNEKLVTRGDTELYNLALSGYSRSRGRAPLYDFPWSELGDGLVVDVGGGVGMLNFQTHTNRSPAVSTISKFR
ncbi:hypothetical protein SLS62_009902 [Diatrype stigma]|uniref:O-methyltransferase domain-containing protein n=1 Tax=Diatrype stigma TaxID=117547 RepID=A0AAN9YJG6_9PEZI